MHSTRRSGGFPWCKAFAFLLMVTLGIACFVFVMHFVTLRTAAPRSMPQTGWCCLRQGKSCMKTDAMQCGAGGGFAFARDQMLCDVACAPFPPPNAASTGNQR